MAETEDSGVMSLTVTLLSAYFANNTVPSGELPALVEGTRRALLGDAPVATPVAAPVAEEVAPEVPVATPVTEEIVPETPVAAQEYKPKVSIEESLAWPDHILSLIDGKPYKTLKRHLAAQGLRSEEHTSELQSLMRNSYAVFCLKKKTVTNHMNVTIMLLLN